MIELRRRHQEEQRQLNAKVQELQGKLKNASKKKQSEIKQQISKMTQDLTEKQQKEVKESEAGKAKTETLSFSAPIQTSPVEDKQHVKISSVQSSSSTSSSANPSGNNNQSNNSNKKKKKQFFELTEEEKIALQESEAKKRQAILDSQSDIAKLSKTSAREEEMEAMRKKIAFRGLYVEIIPPDGNCLYQAVAHQLKERILNSETVDDEKSQQIINKFLEISTVSQTDKENVKTGILHQQLIRKLVASHMRSHKEDFMFFIENGDDPEVFSKYCDDIESSPAWGGHLELQAITSALQICIAIIQADGNDIFIGEDFKQEDEEEDDEDEDEEGNVTTQTTITKPKIEGNTLFVAFHKHFVSTGEHYNSLTSLKPEEDDNN